jgi:hypothetical protein
MNCAIKTRKRNTVKIGATFIYISVRCTLDFPLLPFSTNIWVLCTLYYLLPAAEPRNICSKKFYYKYQVQSTAIFSSIHKYPQKKSKLQNILGFMFFDMPTRYNSSSADWRTPQTVSLTSSHRSMPQNIHFNPKCSEAGFFD